MQAHEPTDKDLKSQEKSASITQPAEAPEAPLPRRFERYTLLKRIARGGMGEVFLAAAGAIEGAERPCVVKTIRREHEGDRSFLARFLDEARIQAQLQHPGVAQIVEATNDAEGKPYVVVEYIEGRNLSDVRSRSAQLNVRIAWPEAVAFGISMGEALAHVHERTDASGKPLEIVHRDLSPQNVMVGYGGELKLIDFGTARGQNRRCHTVAGIVFAKPGYVAPEVANNTPGGVPADLYAYGIMLWELIAGRRFLVGEASVHMALVGAGKRQPTPLAQLVGAPAEIDQVIAQLTAAKIEDRYPSALHAVSDLVKLLQRSPSMANGDRSVRGRISQLMGRLYPAEPARSRADFASRVAEARAAEPPKAAATLPPSPPPAPASEVDAQLLPGTRYRIMREIGRGSMGVVYEAYHVDLIRFVALKVLDKDSVSEATCSRLRAEARAIAQLSHDHLVKLYDFGIAADERPFYAMELLAGESLDKRLERGGPLPVRQAVDLAIQACRALEAAHAAGVIHRDIKPGNLMLSADQKLKLCDFGVAKAESEVDANADAGAFTLVGTPEYMAPEQARGQADARSDVYALGAVLYELLTGHRPHEGESTLALLEEKRKAVPVPPSDRVMGIPAALDQVVLAALSPDPDRRPKSAAELGARLEQSLTERTHAKSRRRGVAYAAASVIAMVALGIAGLAVAKSALPSRAHAMVAPLLEKLGSRAEQLAAPQAKTPAPVVNVAVDEPDVVVENEESDQVEVAGAEPAAEPSSDQAPAEADAETPSEAAPAEAQAEAKPSVLAEVERLKAKGSKLKALDMLRRAARSAPKDAAILKELCLTQQELRAWGEAAKAARQWAKADPSIEAQLSLARLEKATGHRARAVAVLSKLLKSEPEAREAAAMMAELGAQHRVALR